MSLRERLRGLTLGERIVGSLFGLTVAIAGFYTLTLHYGLGERTPRTQREIAAVCGISRCYVSRIEKKALHKLALAMEDRDG